MKKSVFEMIALEEELNAFSEVQKVKYTKYMAQIEEIEKYLETADIPDAVADAIDDAKEALEEKMFAEAHESAEKIRNSEEFKKFMETYKHPVF